MTTTVVEDVAPITEYGATIDVVFSAETWNAYSLGSERIICQFRVHPRATESLYQCDTELGTISRPGSYTLRVIVPDSAGELLTAYPYVFFDFVRIDADAVNTYIPGQVKWPTQPAVTKKTAQDDLYTLTEFYSEVVDISGASWYYSVSNAAPTLLSLDPTIDLTGATDVSSKVQAAINSVSNTEIIVPPGLLLAANIDLKPGVTLRGQGPENTIWLATANNDKIFQYTASATVTELALRDMAFSNNSKTNCYAIFIDGTDGTKRVSEVTLADLKMTGAFVRGLHLEFCANTHISNVFQSLVHDAFYLVSCADTNMQDCEAQLGDGYGFYIEGSAGAYDEGVRMVQCITNGQYYGLYITGQDWGNASACSFTTAQSGPAVLVNVENWDFVGCEFSTAGGAPAASAFVLDTDCKEIGFAGCKFILSTFGLVLRGTNHTVSGCRFKGNSNTDLYLNDALYCAVTGNSMSSSGVTSSIVEYGTSNYNAIIGNVRNGTETIIGGSTTSANNVNY